MPHMNRSRTRSVVTLGLAVALVGLMSWQAVPSHVAVDPCTTPAFTAPRSFAVGPQPYSVAVGDFDGDGNGDLVTANRETNNPIDPRGVSVLLGTGAGSFGVARHFPVAPHGPPINFTNPEPHSVAAGDFNHDGKSDIATANSNSNDVSVLLSTGGGDFQDSQQFSTGIRPISIAIGDFDNDGNLDLVTANIGGPGVSVLIGNGAGSFAPATEIFFGISLNTVVTDDFNGDGRDDLALTDGASGDLSVLLSTGAGGFGPITNYHIGVASHCVAIGDFNGDGIKDLAVGDTGGGISVLLGTGTGSFAKRGSFAPFVGPYSISVGDFNGDNKADLVVANLDERFTISLGTGTGDFGTPTAFDFPVGTGFRSVATGNFNRDAMSDFVTANSGLNSVYVFLSTCITSDTTPPVLTVPSTITITATSPAGAVVTYSVSATDNLDPNPVVSCTPQSGSTFPIGSTSVNCTATDASNNSASDSFTVVVAQAAPPPCTPVPTPTPDISLGHLQRSVALGPIISRGGTPPTQQDLNQNPSNLLFGYNPNPCVAPDPNSNIEILKRSHTHWVRLWADWPTLQPSSPSDPNSPFGTVETDPATGPFIRNLDEQIKTARKEGFGVILTAYRFPEWANNTNSDSSGLGREPRFRVPTDLGVSSPWAKWIKFLIERYGFTRGKIDPNNQSAQDYLRYIDFLEVVNEPNSQMWPQQNQDGLVMPRRVARMFKTAQVKLNEVNAGTNANETALRLAGPAVIDVGGSACHKETKIPCQDPRTCTPYGRFSKELLRELREIPFKADEKFAWSHHNYRDIECDRAGPTEVRNGELQDPKYPQTNSAAWVRQLLILGVDRGSKRYEWNGWPRDNHPKLLITEGGARLNGVSAKYDISISGDLPKLKRKQAALVKRNFNRMDHGPLSKGIALINNYLTYTDPCSDSGLYDFIGSCADWGVRAAGCNNPRCTNDKPDGGIVTRPLFSTWASLPP